MLVRKSLIFFNHFPFGSTRGQPTYAIQIDNFNKLWDWFEKQCELYTIYKLFGQMKVLAIPLIHSKRFFRSSHQRCSVTKGILRNFAKFTGKHLCQGLFFNKVAGLSPKCCGISKNTFFYRILPDDCFYFLKRKMKKRYGDMIIFTDMQGETDVVCLKETANIILKDTWHNKLKHGCKI